MFNRRDFLKACAASPIAAIPLTALASSKTDTPQLHREQLFPTGLKELDKQLDGGIRADDLVTILGDEFFVKGFAKRLNEPYNHTWHWAHWITGVQGVPVEEFKGRFQDYINKHHTGLLIIDLDGLQENLPDEIEYLVHTVRKYRAGENGRVFPLVVQLTKLSGRGCVPFNLYNYSTVVLEGYQGRMNLLKSRFTSITQPEMHYFYGPTTGKIYDCEPRWFFQNRHTVSAEKT